MRPYVFNTLRKADRLARRILPDRLYGRLRGAAIVVLMPRADASGVTEQQAVAPAIFNAAPAPVAPADPAAKDETAAPRAERAARRVHSDQLGEIASDFIFRSGEVQAPGGSGLSWISPDAGTVDLVFCCAFHGRHDLLRQVVAETLSPAMPDVSVAWMLTGSSREDFEFIAQLSSEYGSVAGFCTENNPLGRKWQTCVKLASVYYNASLYGITGSDDIVSSGLIRHIVARHRRNLAATAGGGFMPAMYGTLEWLVAEVSSELEGRPQIYRCYYKYGHAMMPLGAGRFYTRDFIDRTGGILFESDRDRLLDDRGYYEVRNRGLPIEYYTVADGPVFSLKGPWQQLNPLEAFFKAGTLGIEEYSFAGYRVLRAALTRETFSRLYERAPLTEAPRCPAAAE